MKPSTDLHKLIHSLSKSEKRFFKLSSTFQKGDKNYIRLFDFIEQQEEYDEEKVKHHFKSETFIKHLPSEKNFLLNQILKSLRSYYSENNAESRILSELQNIEVLYKKRLFKNCWKRINKAIKIAQKNEKFYHLVTLINWKKKVLDETLHHQNFKLTPQEVRDEEINALITLENLATYRLLFTKAETAIQKYGYFYSKESMELANSLLNHPNIANLEKAISIKAKVFGNYIKGIAHVMIKEFSSALVYLSKVKDILNDNEAIKYDLITLYLNIINIEISCTLLTSSAEKAEKVLNEIYFLEKTRLINSKRTRLKLQSIKFIQSINMNILYGKIDESIKLHQEWGGDLIKEISRVEQISAYFYLAYTYYVAGNQKAALSHINEVLNESGVTVRKDLLIFSRILDLMIHIELENFDLLDYSVGSTGRFFNKVCPDNKFILLIFNLLKKIIKKKDPNDIKLLKTYKAKIEQFSLEDDNNMINKTYITLTLNWIKAKSKKISLREVLINDN